MVRFNADSLIEPIRNNWEKPTTPFFIIILSFFCINFFWGKTDINVSPIKIDYYTLAFSLFIVFVIGLLWKTTNKLPKREKGKILIIVAIHTETEDEQNRLLTQLSG